MTSIDAGFHTPSALASFVTDCDHGILVVECRGTRVTHTDWDAAVEPADLRHDSLFIRASPSVDGEVRVSVYDGDDVVAAPTDGILLFDGTLTLTSRLLVVCDSDENVAHELEMSRDQARIVVYGDDLQFSENVAIFLFASSN